MELDFIPLLVVSLCWSYTSVSQTVGLDPPVGRMDKFWIILFQEFPILQKYEVYVLLLLLLLFRWLYIEFVHNMVFYLKKHG